MLGKLGLLLVIATGLIQDVQCQCTSLRIEGALVQWLEPDPNSYGDNCLQSGPTFVVAWKNEKVNNQKKVFVEVHAKTTGWIGVGVNNRFSMLGADVAVFWTSGSDSFIYDVKNNDLQHVKPIYDPAAGGFNNVELIYKREINGITSVQYSRPALKSDAEDLEVTKEKQWLIWAYGDSDPFGNNINNLQKHIRTGGSFVALGTSSRMTSPVIFILLLIALGTAIFSRL